MSFIGRIHAVLEGRLPGVIGIGEHRRIDVHHDLIALAGRAGVEVVVQRGLGEESQGVGLLLGHAGGVLPRRVRLGFRGRLITRRGQRLPDHRADFGGEPAVDDEHAVDVLIDAQGPAAIALVGLSVLGVAVHPAPGPGQGFDV